jgi:hypothetical protein
MTVTTPSSDDMAASDTAGDTCFHRSCSRYLEMIKSRGKTFKRMLIESQADKRGIYVIAVDAETELNRVFSPCRSEYKRGRFMSWSELMGAMVPAPSPKNAKMLKKCIDSYRPDKEMLLFFVLTKVDYFEAYLFCLCL